MERRTQHREIYDLLLQDHYTPDELAELLGMDRRTIEQEAYNRRLRASIVEHEVLSIRREDVLDWFAHRSSNV
ncbi:MAG: helix-turn-helix domain-containing protein [Thermomicrobiales bacterium]|nr:helix-turn-helix domain-containing protein [Thermomicrobiales bacterium]